MKKKNKNAKINLIFLSIIFVLSIYGCFENYAFLKQDNSPFVYDLLNIYLESGRYYEYIKSFRVTELTKYCFNEYPLLNPPFLIFQPIPFYFLFGFNEDTASLSNSIHLFILLFSSYFIGKKLINEYVGFISSLILFFVPGFLPFSRVFLQDFALASFVNLSIALFLYSENLKRRIFSFFLGISLGLGMLTKLNFPLYILPYAILIFFAYFFKKKKKATQTRYQIINILMLLIVFSIIVFPWYFFNFENTLTKLSNMKYYIQIKHFSDASFAKSSFSVLKGYFIQLKDILLKHYLFLAIIALVFFIIKQIKKREITKELVLLIIGNSLSFLILLFTPANPRYLLSFLFLICLIIAIIIFDLFVLIYKKEKKLKFNNAFFLFIILLFLLVLTYKGNVKTLYYHSSLTERFYSEGLIVPERSIIKIDEIINLIKNKMNQLAGNRILVLSTTENAYLILTRLKYEKAYEINDDLFCITRSDIKNVSDDCRLNEKTMDYCNYEIVIDFDIHVDDDEKKMLEIKFPERMKMASMIISNWEKCKKNYNLIDSITDKRLETNKNITVYIYEKKLT